MALVSAVHSPISRRLAQITTPRSRYLFPVLWAALLTFLIGGPWLLPGYLFGTDWPGPRQIQYPTDLSSFAPLQFVLATASAAFGAEATGKVLVLGILFTAALLASQAAPAKGFVPGTVAATIYVVNPFVYGRLHYGQLYLLAGYALLPWVARRLQILIRQPRLGAAIVSSVSLILLGILSLHLFLAAAVLAAALVIAHSISNRTHIAYLRRLAAFVLVVALGTFVASSYWIIPLLQGRGPEGSKLSGIGTADLYAFAAIPDQQLGLVPNLLGLYGFWAEAVGRFTPMKDFAPMWPAILVLILIVCGFGAFSALTRRHELLAPWVAGLLAAAIVALILEMGVSNPLTSGLVRWLDTNIPPYRGMRDAGKWAALLALTYSQLGALGAAALLRWIRKPDISGLGSEWVASGAVAVLLAVPLYYGNGLLYGAHGEIKPSQYPASWYAADRVLSSDSHPGRTLFLPWHEYMAFGFIQNQNKVVAPPGPNFFSVPLVVSLDPELPGIGPPPTPDQIALYNLVREGSQGNWAEVLASRDIKYILLAREVDWQSYKYLDTQPDLVLVRDFGSIALYRNVLIS